MRVDREFSSVRKIAYMGLLFALAIALSALESVLPSFVPVPGIKLGLANIVTMYCLYILGWRSALSVAVLKALFALITRGFTGGLLSLCGGVLSVVVMGGLLLLLGTRVSAAMVSIGGAVSHNLGQIAAASLLLHLPALWYYLPVLIVAGIVMGLLNAVLLRALQASGRQILDRKHGP